MGKLDPGGDPVSPVSHERLIRLFLPCVCGSRGGLRTTHTAPPSHLGRDQAADLTIILNAEDRRQLTRGGLLPSLASSQGPVAAACLRTCFIVTGKTTDPGKPGALSGGSAQQHARAHLMKPLWEAAARRQPSPRPISVHCSPYRRFVGTAPRSSGGGIAGLFKFLCGKNRRAQRASLRATSHEIIIGSLWAEMSFFRWSASCRKVLQRRAERQKKGPERDEISDS